MKTADEPDLKRVAPEILDRPGFVTDAREVSDIGLREVITYALLLLFVGATATTYVLIFLWGYGKVNFPNAFIHWLGAATIGQTGSLLVIIVKSLFPGSNSKGRSAKK